MWLWLSECILLIAHFDYPHKGCTGSTVWLLHGWCHMKLLPSWHKVCVLHSTMHQFTVSLHSKPYRVHVCLAVTCHLHFWQNGQDLLHATAVIQECNWYWNMSQHRKLTMEKKILPLSCWDSNPGSFDHVSDFLTTAIPVCMAYGCMCMPASPPLHLYSFFCEDESVSVVVQMKSLPAVHSGRNVCMSSQLSGRRVETGFVVVTAVFFTVA